MDEPTATSFVVMRDGTRLATDVYLPDRAARVPAVLARTPYDMRGNTVWFGAIGRLFADAGIAFVAQDTRGRYRSDGVSAPFEPELRDGFDTCEWITHQRWSDHTVAVFGESYAGFTAMAAAASGHPAIRAAAMRATTTDVAGDWLRHQGVLRLEFATMWALAAWAGRDIVMPELDWSIRPLAAHLPAVSPDRLPTVLDAWARGPGTKAAYPGDRRWPALIRKVRVPAHFTAGWWDLFVRGELRDWSDHANHCGHESMLSVEATDHAGHDWGDGPTPDPIADYDALAARLPTLLRAEMTFLRRHLVGADAVSTTGDVSWTLTHVGRQESPSWPPRGTESLCLYLVDAGNAHHGPEGGSLSPRPDRIPIESRWRHDPQHLVPSLEGEAIDGWFRPPDERVTQVRDDVLTFTADPVRAPLDLAGPVTVDLAATSSHARGHLMVKLCDVRPTGEAHRIIDGAGVIDADATTTTIVLGHTGYRLRPGHRLRLEVASSAFPRYIWHPGTTVDPWDAVRTHTAETRLQTGPGGSRVALTVLSTPVRS